MATNLLHPVTLTALQAERSLGRSGQLAGVAALVLSVIALGLLIS
jgi:hypothetical protein